MKISILLIVCAFCCCSAAQESRSYKNVVDCRYGQSEKSFYLKDSELKYPERIRKVVLDLLKMDLMEKIDAIGFVFPEDLDDTEGEMYELQLKSYSESRFLKQASCLVKHYKEGDKVYFFEQDHNLDSYYIGYALMRDSNLIVIVVTGGLQI